MKILKTGAICVLTCLCYVHSAAQQNQQPAVTEKSDYVKPRIFADLPSKLQLNVPMLESMLNDEVGTRVAFALGQGFQFQGLVVSKSDATDKHTRTVVVKATNRQGVALTFTRNTNSDGTYSYMGRMLSFKHGDAFEITEEGGQLVMVKKEQHDLLEE
ncbi:MAG: hypothetical protein ACO1NX_06825 [Chitinophagaceae bacterium]